MVKYRPLTDFIDGEGNVTLHHFTPHLSDDDVTLDPSHVGKHSYTRNDMKVSPSPRLFFYLDPSEKEYLVGGKHYVAKVPAKDLYDLRKDEHKLVSSDLGRSLANIAERGYKGVQYDTGDRAIVNWFHPIVAHAKLAKWTGDRAWFETGNGDNEYKAKWIREKPRAEPMLDMEHLIHHFGHPIDEFSFEHQMAGPIGDTETNPQGILGVGHAREAIRKSAELLLAGLQEHKPHAVYFTAKEPSRQKLYNKLVPHISQFNPDYVGYRFTNNVLHHILVHKDHEQKFVDAAEKVGLPITKVTSDSVAKLARSAIEPITRMLYDNSINGLKVPALPDEVIEAFTNATKYGGDKTAHNALHTWATEVPEHWGYIEPLKTALTYPQMKSGTLRPLEVGSNWSSPDAPQRRYISLSHTDPSYNPSSLTVKLGGVGNKDRKPAIEVRLAHAGRQIASTHVIPATLWHAIAEKLELPQHFRELALAKWPKYTTAKLARGLNDVVPQMTSKQEDVRVLLAKRILSEAGLHGRVTPSLYLSGDSRPSVTQTIMHEGDPDAVRYLAAWYGLMAKEPRLTVFHVGEGDDKLHTLTTGAKPSEVQKVLRATGISSASMSGNKIHIYDQGGRLTPFIQQAGLALHAINSTQSGTGTQLGSPSKGATAAASAADSRQSYRSIVSKFEQRSAPAAAAPSANGQQAAAPSS